MKKSLVGRVIAIVIAVVILAMFAYFYVQLNRMDKQMNELQVTIGEDAGKVASIVNFFNANQPQQ